MRPAGKARKPGTRRDRNELGEDRVTGTRPVVAELPRPHDYRQLVQRWRALAGRAGLRLRTLAWADGFPLFYLRTPALQRSGGLYLSAGIHGDEPGSTEGLLAWAERHLAQLKSWPLLIFPCLNPWGLKQNLRLDARGTDLNRVFHREDLPQLTAVKKLLEGFQFEAAIMLHEDYDGQGIYLYEIQRCDPHWGEQLLAAAAPVLPLEPRSRVDRYHATGGLIRRKFDQPRYTRMGYPEAIWLHLYHSRRTFTVETPSEFGIEQRAEGHCAVLDETVRLLAAEAPAVWPLPAKLARRVRP